MNDSEFVEAVRTRMLEMDAAGSLDLEQLRRELHRTTGRRYTTQTLRNYKSGNNRTFSLSVGIAMTGLLPGLPALNVPGWLLRRLIRRTASSGRHGGRR